MSHFVNEFTKPTQGPGLCSYLSNSNPGVDMLGLTFSYHFGADQQLVSAVQDEQK